MAFTKIAMPVLAGAAAMFLGAVAWASPDPATTTTTFPGTGGDEVSGSGEWIAVTDLDASNCNIDLHRLDYATMTWAAHSTVTTVLTATCSNGEFGTATSLDGNVLVVGAPSWDGAFTDDPNDYGGLAIFEFDGTDWNRIGGLSHAFGLMEQAPDFQVGARYGQSVAISQSAADANEYLVAVGASLHDEGGSDNGKVYLYRYDAVSNMLTLLDQFPGASGDEMGTSVAADYPWALAGGPASSLFGAGSGRVSLYEAEDLVGGDGILDDAAFRQNLVSAAGDALGFKVSLTADVALSSGASDARSYGNTGTPTNRTYADFGQNVATDAGDVSQINPAAFGDRTGEVIRIYRDIATDDVTPGTGDEILVDVATDYATSGGAGDEIRLLEDSLWTSNPPADRVILYQFPCSYGTRLEQFGFNIISIPCDVAGMTVDQVFGTLGTYDVNYRMWRVVDANAALANPTVRMAATDVLDPDRAYWLQTDADQYFAIPASVSTTFSGSLAPLVQNDPSVRRIREVALPLPADPGSGDPADFFSRLQIANPFSRVMEWGKVLYVSPVGGPGIVDIDDPSAAPYISPTAHVYDPGAVMGQDYRAITTTPGFANEIQPYEGFWIRLESQAAESGDPDGGVLVLPLAQ